MEKQNNEHNEPRWSLRAENEWRHSIAANIRRLQCDNQFAATEWKQTVAAIKAIEEEREEMEERAREMAEQHRADEYADLLDRRDALMAQMDAIDDEIALMTEDRV
jgi:hypothetical protein